MKLILAIQEWRIAGDVRQRRSQVWSRCPKRQSCNEKPGSGC